MVRMSIVAKRFIAVVLGSSDNGCERLLPIHGVIVAVSAPQKFEESELNTNWNGEQEAETREKKVHELTIVPAGSGQDVIAVAVKISPKLHGPVPTGSRKK